MSKDKEIINKLFNVVANQQKIITKIAQTLGSPTNVPSSDIKSSVEADIYDIIYGRGAKVPAFGNKIEVLYAKKTNLPTGNNLIVGLTVPDVFQQKWESIKSNVEMALKNKYGVSTVTWRE